MRDPRPTLPLLERLKDDPEEYVRRSVANHLNDIGKDHPETVVAICRAWSKDATPERGRIIRHATRSLVKAGHAGAMELHGAAEKPAVRVVSFTAGHQRVKIGGAQTLAFHLVSTARKPQRLIVDFAVQYRKADGSARPKVFKWAVLDLAPGGEVRRDKKLPFKVITTRRFYPGVHRVDLLINGRVSGAVDFELLAAK
ncbi:MAG: hypothetical protein U1F77_17990 [Kiritimatiellia bacterium]